MIKKYFLSLTIFSLILVGCNIISTITTRKDNSQPAQLTPTLANNLANTIPSPLLNQKCLSSLRSYTWDKYMFGTLVLTSSDLSGSYFLDMSNGTRKSITQNESDIALDFSVSPNGYWIAYIYQGESDLAESLIIQSSDEQENYVYPVNRDEWQSIAYWLNNETLLLWNHDSPLDNLIFFNPFTEEKWLMPNEYPNILPEDSGWDEFWPSITIYDPSLRKVVYLGTNENGYQPGNSTLVLWNVINNQQITTVINMGYTLVHPIWKSDGSGLIFVKSLTGYDDKREDEVFFISSDGETKQLTNLSNMYISPNIYSASLSPDERYLAIELITNFGRKTVEVVDRRILILDMTSEELIDYCLVPEQFAHLTWSPDSRYLAFSQPLSDEDAQTVILDILNEETFVIAEHLRPQGWMDLEK